MMKQYKASKDVEIASTRQLRQNLNQGSTLEVVFNTKNAGMTYKTASNLAIFPENSTKDVAQCQALLGFSDEQMQTKIVLKPNAAYTGRSQKMPFPLPADGMSLSDVIRKFVVLRDKITIKEFKVYSDLCEAGEDKQR